MKKFLRLLQASNAPFSSISRTGFLLAIFLLLTGFSVNAQPTLSYVSPQSYLQNTAITPLLPTSSGVSAPGYNNAPSQIGSGLTGSVADAVDASGNIYIANRGGTPNVYKIAAGTTTPVVMGSGVFDSPNCIAADVTGDVFVTDLFSGILYEFPAGSNTPVTIGPTFTEPAGLAVDGAGNVYVVDAGNSSITLIPAGGGTPSVVISGLNQPGNIAVDATGNIFTIDQNGTAVEELPKGGSSMVTLLTGLTFGIGMVADASGNVYYTDSSVLYEIPAGGSAAITVKSSIGAVFGLARDASANFFMVGYGQDYLAELTPTGGYYLGTPLPAGLSFNSTTGAISGTPTVLSPAATYAVTAYNNSGGTQANVNIMIVGPPTLSYAGPQIYLQNTAITPLLPTSSGVSAPGYNNAPSQIGSGLTGSVADAVDASGNIYIANRGGTPNVYKIAAGTTTPVVMGSGVFDSPNCIATDVTGDVFVTDLFSGILYEFPAGSNTPVTIGPTFTEPAGLAVDGAGNVYVVDAGNSSITLIPAGGGTPSVVISGLNQPGNIAVDATGNIFTVDQNGTAVEELPKGGSSMVTLVTGLTFGIGMVADALGNVYYTDSSVLYEIPAGGSAAITVKSSIGAVFGLARDASANFFMVGYAQDYLAELTPTGGYYLGTSLPAGLSFNSTTGAISGTPTVAGLPKNYTITAYNGDGGTSVKINLQVRPIAPATISYATPQTYTAGNPISPLAPTGSGVDAPAYSTSPYTTASGFLTPLAVATDPSGNVYVADKGNSEIKEFVKGCGPAIILGPVFNAPTGVAVDKAGNVYVADGSIPAITEIPAGNGTPTDIGSGFTSPAGVAVDSAGNVYVADAGLNEIFKMEAGTGNTILVQSGFANLTGIAVDSKGNIYASDGSSGAVYKLTPGASAPESIGGTTTFGFPSNVAVDASGNVFVTDGTNQLVYEIAGGRGNAFSLGSSFGFPGGAAVDGAGNLYVTDTNVLDKFSPIGGYYINRTLPPGLKLNDTTGVVSGTPKNASLATSYNITGYNAGGGTAAPLNITITVPPVPVVSYANPVTYVAGTAITPLTPSNAGGAVASPAYGAAAAIGSGFNSPAGVAVDAAGNVYVADSFNGVVKEIPVGGGAPVSMGSGFNHPVGISIDAAGNIYVADSGNGSVFELPAGGGTQVTLSSGFVQPDGVAADALGNVYVTDEYAGANGSTLYKLPVGGGTPLVLQQNFVELTAIAIDQSNNLYVLDGGASTLYYIQAGGVSPVPIGPQFVYPTSVAVDAAGNIYVTDGDTNSLYKLTNNGFGPFTVSDSFYSPNGVAVDGTGKLYVGDSNNNAVDEITPTGGYFINTALPANLHIDDKTGNIAGAPTGASAAANYMVTAYNAGGGSSATINITITLPPPPAITYVTPQVYTAGTAISPLDPSNTGGGVAFPAYGSPAAIGSGFNSPSGVAVDAAGNVYIANSNLGQVDEIPVAGGAPISIGSGFNHPVGISIDAAGNIYVADPGNASVFELPAGGGTQITLGSGFTLPDGVVADAAGNVYVTDAYPSANGSTLYKIPAGSSTPVVLQQYFVELTGIAIDQSNNLYVVDGGASSLYGIQAGGVLPIPIGPLFVYPTSVAVDAAGNIYVTDGDTNSLYKFTNNGLGPFTITSIFNSPNGVAVDGTGKLYVGDSNNNAVDEITPAGGYFINNALPANLFIDGKTGDISGTPKSGSAAANYVVTAYNPGGAGSATINVTVTLPPPPAITYVTPQVYTAGTAISPLDPSNTGGAVDLPSYNSTFTQVGSGYNTPMGVAVDAAGDVFVADAFRGQVEEYGPNNGPLLNTYTGFNYPTGVALDAGGDIFVADQGGGQVYEIAFGTTTPVAIGSGFSGPNAVTVDAAGNVYVTDDSSGTISKILAGNPTPVTLVSGLLYAAAITNDGAGTLYFVDGGASTVYKLSEAGGTPVPVADNFIFPTAIAIDASGNIYVTDGDADVLLKLPAGNLSEIQIAGGFNNPGGVAVDGAGNLYVGDSNNNVVDEVAPTGGYFINTALPAGLSMSNKTGIISGTPSTGSRPTNYTITGYNPGGSGAAVENITVNLPPAPTLSYVTPDVYPLSAAITPLVPTSAGVSAPAYNPVISTIGGSFIFPSGVALDNAGDVLIADAGSNTVSLTHPGPFGGTFPVGSGFNAPAGVAVDGSGNIYVADSGDGLVEKVQIGGGAPVNIAGTGFFNYPLAVAVDVKGNVYVADPGLGELIEVPGGTGTPVSIGTGFTYPSSVAVDAAGNVYATDLLSGKAYEIPVGGGPQVRIGGIFNSPYGIAVDASGNVYISDALVGLVKEYPSGGGTPVTISGFGAPYGLAVDGAGNLYVGDVGNQVVDVSNPVGGFYITPAVPAGLAFNSTTGIISGTPTAGTAATNYTVSGYNPGGSATANLNIQITSSNDNLSNLTISTGTLSPTFATATTGYSISYPNSVTSVTLTPTASDPGAVITINGTAVASGSASGSIHLLGGANVIQTVVTSSDGSQTQTYTVTATKPLSTDAFLSTIYLTPNAPLTTVTGPDYKDFTASVSNTTSSISLTAVTHDPTATVTTNGSPAASGTATPPINLSVGINTITTVVTAQDGSTKTFVITITRAPSTDAYISSISLTPATMLTLVTGAEYRDYTASVSSATAAVQVTTVTKDPTATITVNGSPVASGSLSNPISLNFGSTTIITTVQAQNGDTKSFVITVTRPLSTNAFLTTIYLTPGAPLTTVAGAEYKDFTASVANTTTSVQVTAVTQDPMARLNIQGFAVNSGTASAPINLAVGPNNIITTCTAQDGSSKSFVITVTRAAATDSYLSTLFLSPATPLTTVTGPDYKDFTASVANSLTAIQATAIAQDPTATITVNGTPVTSGTESSPISLSVGPNTITTIVKAQDGSTRTFVITVTRAGSPDSYLSTIYLTPGAPLTTVTGPDYKDFTASVGHAVATIQVTAVTHDPTATIATDGTPVASGSPSGAIALSVGPNAVTTVVTAQDGSTKTFVITVTRAASSLDGYNGISVTASTTTPILNEDGIFVHQGVSPNGDGIDDFLTIDHIASYPDNKLMIMNRNGQLIYEATGYDNASKVFDGHSNKNGQMQLPGTYFYQLDYTVAGITKHKTGFLVLKY